MRALSIRETTPVEPIARRSAARVIPLEDMRRKKSQQNAVKDILESYRKNLMSALREYQEDMAVIFDDFVTELDQASTSAKP